MGQNNLPLMSIDPKLFNPTFLMLRGFGRASCKLTPCISCCSLHFSTSRGCLKLPWPLLPLNAAVYTVSHAGRVHLISLRSGIKYLSLSSIPFLLHQHVTHFLIPLETVQTHRPTGSMVTGVLTSPGPCSCPILRLSPSKTGPSARVI